MLFEGNYIKFWILIAKLVCGFIICFYYSWVIYKIINNAEDRKL